MTRIDLQRLTPQPLPAAWRHQAGFMRGDPSRKQHMTRERPATYPMDKFLPALHNAYIRRSVVNAQRATSGEQS